MQQTPLLRASIPVSFYADMHGCVSGVKPEVQQHLVNLPFNGEHLFGPQVDLMLEKIKKDTVKAMGALPTSLGRNIFHHHSRGIHILPQAATAANTLTELLWRRI